jgi:Golgi phosphoprotein 3
LAMVCAAYAANVLENVLTTLQPEARERAYAQVDYLLKCYSRWPFAKNAEGNTGIGANLFQVVSEEVSKGKDRDLHLQVCRSSSGTQESNVERLSPRV